MAESIHSYLNKNGSINFRSLRSARNFMKAALSQRKLGCASVDDLRTGLALGARLSRTEMAAHISILLDCCFTPSLDPYEKLGLRLRPGIDSEESFMKAVLVYLRTHKTPGGNEFPATARFIRDCRLYGNPGARRRGSFDEHYASPALLRRESFDERYKKTSQKDKAEEVTPRLLRFSNIGKGPPLIDTSPSTITESTYGSTVDRKESDDEYRERDQEELTVVDMVGLGDIRGRARRDGIDFLFPQDMHDKVLAGIFVAVKESPSGAIENQQLIDTVMTLKSSGYVSHMENLTTTHASALIRLLMNCSVIVPTQELRKSAGGSGSEDAESVEWALTKDVETFEELRTKHDTYAAAYLRRTSIEVSPNVMGKIVWKFGKQETLTRLRAIRYFMADCRKLFYPSATVPLSEEIAPVHPLVTIGIAEKVTFGDTVVFDNERRPASIRTAEGATVPAAVEDAAGGAEVGIRQKDTKLGYAEGDSSKTTQMKSLTVCVDPTDDLSPRGGSNAGVTPKVFYGGSHLSPLPTCASSATVDLYDHFRTEDSPPLQIEAVGEPESFQKKDFGEESESPDGSPSSYLSAEELLAKAIYPSTSFDSSTHSVETTSADHVGGSLPLMTIESDNEAFMKAGMAGGERSPRLDYSTFLPTSYGQLFEAAANSPPRSWRSRESAAGIAQRQPWGFTNAISQMPGQVSSQPTAHVSPMFHMGPMSQPLAPLAPQMIGSTTPFGQMGASTIPRPMSAVRSLFREVQEEHQRMQQQAYISTPPGFHQHYDLGGPSHPHVTHSSIARSQMGAFEHSPTTTGRQGAMSSIPAPFASHLLHHHYLPPAPSEPLQRWGNHPWGIHRQVVASHGFTTVHTTTALDSYQTSTGHTTTSQWQDHQQSPPGRENT